MSRRSKIVLIILILMIAACTAVNVTFDKPDGWGLIVNFGGLWDHPEPVMETNDGGRTDADQ